MQRSAAEGFPALRLLPGLFSLGSLHEGFPLFGFPLPFDLGVFPLVASA